MRNLLKRFSSSNGNTNSSEAPAKARRDTAAVIASALEPLESRLLMSHFRSGSLSWESVSGNTVEFHMTEALRWSSVSNAPVGGIVSDSFGGNPPLNYGDGTNSGSITFRVVSINATEDWALVEAVRPLSGGGFDEGLIKTYNSTGNYTASMASSARIGSLRNNANAGYRLETTVNVGTTNASPVSSLPPIVQVSDNQIATFSIPAADPQGTPVSFRLSTAAEGGGSFVQPSGISISSDGIVSWDIRDSVRATNPGDLWSMQVMAQDGQTKSPVDFIIKIGQPAAVNQPPTVSANPSGPFQPTAGQALNFTVNASDADGTISTLQALNPPTGMSFGPLTTSGNTASRTVSWTPSQAQASQTFVVTFQTTDNLGATGQTSVTISPAANQPPSADAGGGQSSTYTVNEGGSVALSGTGADPEGTNVSFAWDLDNDGAFDDATGASTTYNAANIDGPVSRTVRLRVTDGFGLQSVDTATVDVENVAPQGVTIGPDQTVDEGGAATFTATFTDPAAADTHEIHWHVSDAAHNIVAHEHGSTLTFTPDAPGEYHVLADVIDDDDGKGTASASLTVRDRGPVANAGPDQTANEGATVNFTGSGSNPAGDAIVSYEWDLDNDGTFETDGANASRSFADNGTYTVKLQVTDDDGDTATDTAVVTVNNVAPKVSDVSVTSSVNEGGTATLKGTITDASSADRFTLTVNWGDGDSDIIDLPAGSKSFSVDHTYTDDNPSGTSSDTYMVTGTLSDDDGGSAPIGNTGTPVSRFYWSQSTTWNAPGVGGAVVGMDFGGANKQVIASGYNRIDDVELDLINGKIYWNNWASGQPNNATEGIFRANLDGSGLFKLVSKAQSNSTSVGASGQHGIAVDAVNGVVYFTRGVSYADGNGGPEVSKINTDGTGYTRLNGNNDGWFTSGIDVDTANGIVYWGSPGVLNTGTGGSVNSVNTDGTNRVYNRVAHADGRGRALAVDAGRGLVFFSSWSIQTPAAGGAIWVLNLNTGAATRVLDDPSTGIADVEVDVDDGRIYWTDFVRGEIRSAPYSAGGALGTRRTEVGGVANVYGLALEEVPSGALQVTVNNVAPALNTGSDETIGPDSRGTFTRGGSFADPGADTWTGTVNYGDNTGIQPLAINPDKTFALDHVYANSGEYTVTVTLRDDDLGVDTKTFKVTANLNRDPVADAGGPYAVAEGGSVTLSGADSTDPDVSNGDSIVKYEWDFDYDGSTFNADVTTDQATAAFSAADLDGPTSRRVALRVTDSRGAVSGVSEAVVTVNNVAPTASIDGPSTGLEGSSLTFTSDVSDPAGAADLITYQWSITKQNGTNPPQPFTYAGLVSNGPALTFVPPDNATYRVKLTVRDGDGGVTTTPEHVVEVANVAPTATLTYDETIDEGGSATFTFSNVEDPSSIDTAAGFRYHFDLDNNGSYETQFNTPVKPADQPTFSKTFTFDDNGVRVVKARILDANSGNTVYTATVTVNNVAPTATINNDGPVDEGSPATVSLTGAADPSTADAAGLRYFFSTSESDRDAATYAASGSASFKAFTFNDNGDYVVYARVIDKDGGDSDYETTVRVNNVAPTATINGAPATSDEGDEISLTSTVTDPGSADTHTYAWSVTKDGAAYASGTEAAFRFTPDDNGSYVVTLTVKDDDGGAVTDTATVAVKNVAPTPSIDSIGATRLEGTAIAVKGSATDPARDNDTLSYGWVVYKDGSEYATGAGADWSFTPKDNGSYKIVLTARDEDGGSTSIDETISVANVPPAVENVVLDKTTINEDGSITVTGTVTDPGSADTHTVSIDWGNGETSGPITVNGDGTFSSTHRYVDDNPTGTTSDAYTVSVTATDDDGADSAAATAGVTVNNVDPTVALTGDATAARGQERSFRGSFGDVGTADTWTAQVNFGDGTGWQLLALNADKTFAFTHSFAATGTYTVTVKVTDDDGGVGTATHSIVVKAADLQVDPENPAKTALVVGGTNGNDVINLSRTSTGIIVMINGRSEGIFNPTGRIIVYGQDGNDNISVSSVITLTTELHGDAGGDTLTGSGGPSLLMGGTGADLLISGTGRAVHIGGTGADSMNGSGGEDLLIGGTTAYDGNDTALRSIVAEWANATRLYNDRVFRIRSGAFSSSGVKLAAGTVATDSAVDVYSGVKGRDWFVFSAGDTIKDKAADEFAELV